VGKHRGREIRRRARVRTRRSTASGEGVELTGRVHGAERGERGMWGNSSAPSRTGPRSREGRGTRVKATSADKSAPLGNKRERESTRGQTGADRRGPPVKGESRAGAGAGLGRLGCWTAFLFSFSLNFSNSFYFSFL
jgi:hypothetical protein